VVGNSHRVVAQNKYVAIISSTVETEKPVAELQAALDLLPERIVQFDNIGPSLEPLEDGTKSRIFISSTYDASSHFEQTTDDVISMYRRITGEDLDLTKSVEVENLQGGGGGGGHKAKPPKVTFLFSLASNY
jgi:Rab GDP dissociation inhibitor